MEEEGPIRNEKGQMLPGHTANPNGHQGNISLVRMLRDKLQEVPEGEQKTFAELLLDTVFHKAIQQKDVKMIRDIFDRIDGRSVQPTKFMNALTINQALVKFVGEDDGDSADTSFVS